MAKRHKVNQGQNNSFIKGSLKLKEKPKEEAEEEFSLYPPERKECACEHRWHLGKFLENPFIGRYLAIFICDKCGKSKRQESQGEY
jgi:hypothetical protein